MENNKPAVVFKNLATNNCGEKDPSPLPTTPDFRSLSSPSPLPEPAPFTDVPF